MKEIEFRGKTENGELVYGTGIVQLDYHNSIDYIEGTQIILNNGHSYSVIPETVGQNTGLKDITNTKWYQHDIIGEKVPEYIIDYDGSNAMFNAFYINPDGTYDDAYEGDLSMLLKSCKVLGNIHDNPELLEVK